MAPGKSARWRRWKRRPGEDEPLAKLASRDGACVGDNSPSKAAGRTVGNPSRPVCGLGLRTRKRLREPTLGFEPRTYALRKHCSTAELSRQVPFERFN